MTDDGTPADDALDGATLEDSGLRHEAEQRLLRTRPTAVNLAWAVDRLGALTRPRLRRTLERTTGTVMIGIGVSLAVEAR